SQTEKAAVVWCVLNRVDHPDFPDTIHGVLSAPNQFLGFSERFPVDPELLALAQDVLDRWRAETAGASDVGRVLPKDYLWFSADGHGHNAFRATFRQSAAWQWTAESPYPT
ncbi:MAG: cell wall hydrolase, partial [Oscillospiraceae bacterium]|nr:cell wall hydrolase [Oscillospiraceae bacterium]